MKKIEVVYSQYKSGEPTEVKEVVYIERPTFARQAKAQQEAKKYEDEHGIEPVTQALMVAAWCNGKDQKPLTYADIMAADVERVNALYAKALERYMDLPEIAKKKG